MSNTGSSTFQLRRDKRFTAVTAQKLSTSGDLSVGGKSHLNGNTTINSDLAINGGSLTSTASFFELLSLNADGSNATNPTVVNFAVAPPGNTVNIGGSDASATVFIRGNLIVGGKVYSPVGSGPHGLGYVTVATNPTVTLAEDFITGINYAGDAACAVTLPAADGLKECSYLQQVTTEGGTEVLTFTCPGTDVFTTGSVVQSVGAGLPIYTISVAGNNTLTYAPIDADTNFFDVDSQVYFVVSRVSVPPAGGDPAVIGLWTVGTRAVACNTGTIASLALTGTFSFSTVP